LQDNKQQVITFVEEISLVWRTFSWVERTFWQIFTNELQTHFELSKTLLHQERLYNGYIKNTLQDSLPQLTSLPL
jgi:hypothetical protein